MKINIYLNETQRYKAQQIKDKYHVSLSTIADKVAFQLHKYAAFESYETYYLLMTKHLEKPTNKTSIKPKQNPVIKANLEKLGVSPNIFYTNCLIIYLDKRIKEFIKNPKYINEFYTNCDRELQKAKEPNWNYNDLKRNFARLQREQNEQNK